MQAALDDCSKLSFQQFITDCCFKRLKVDRGIKAQVCHVIGEGILLKRLSKAIFQLGVLHLLGALAKGGDICELRVVTEIHLHVLEVTQLYPAGTHS